MEDAYDCIDYSRSNHDTCIVNWASDQIREDAELIDAFAEEQMKQYNK
jgi:hypothetical protein